MFVARIGVIIEILVLSTTICLIYTVLANITQKLRHEYHQTGKNASPPLGWELGVVVDVVVDASVCGSIKGEGVGIAVVGNPEVSHVSRKSGWLRCYRNQ